MSNKAERRGENLSKIVLYGQHDCQLLPENENIAQDVRSVFESLEAAD